MKPLKDYVLLGEVKESKESVTDGGIILTKPETGNIPGLVLAVGPNVEGVEVGQQVICDWKQSTPVMVDRNQCVLLKEDAILAIAKDA